MKLETICQKAGRGLAILALASLLTATPIDLPNNPPSYSQAHAHHTQKKKTAKKKQVLTDNQLLRQYSTYQDPLKIGEKATEKRIKVWGDWGAGRRGRFWKGKSNPHAALDIVADIGTSLYSIGVGRVVYSGFDHDFPKNGYVVEIELANGLRTKYAHLKKLKKPKVRTGQYVNLDTVVGLVGQTGNAKESGQPSHLHIQVTKPKDRSCEVHPYNGWCKIRPRQFFKDGASYHRVVKRKDRREHYLRKFRTIERRTR